MSGAFELRSVTVNYAGQSTAALTDISLDIPTAQLFALIGPNGSGKSTMVRTLLGAISPTHGTVLCEERSLSTWPRRALARRVAAVAQLEEMAFPMTVLELVAMGRYPHLGSFRTETAADRAAIADAMQTCDVTHLAERAVSSLSGGERQRARIARALAQQPATLVLDEPTVALDVAHEMAVFELLRALTRNRGWTVIVATHHINLAARYADRLLLLDGGRTTALGSPAEVIRKDLLEKVYGWPLQLYQHGGTGFDCGAPQISPLSRMIEESQ